MQTSFSFTEISNLAPIDDNKKCFFSTSDQVNLCYYRYRSNEESEILLLIHGGGAHSGAGYQFLAEELATDYGVSVYLLDLRGHGNSGGRKGDAPKSNRVLQDLDEFITFLTFTEQKKIFLGGHSSGAGLIMNYDNQYNNSLLQGYIYIAPEFGYKSNTSKKNAIPFAKIRILNFIFNSMSKGLFFGNKYSVYFNYPIENLNTDPLLINQITVNMSLAMTPENPMQQLESVKHPLMILLGNDDELFDVNAVKKMYEVAAEKISQTTSFHLVDKATHLSILKKSSALISNFIKRIV